MQGKCIWLSLDRKGRTAVPPGGCRVGGWVGVGCVCGVGGGMGRGVEAGGTEGDTCIAGLPLPPPPLPHPANDIHRIDLYHP